MSMGFVVRAFGGPEALEWTDLETPEPGPGEATIRYNTVGVNFIDVYFRSGVYPVSLPMTPGQEGAGVVEAVGDGVTRVAPGDRVAHTGNVGPGSYRERRTVPADRLVKLPDSVSDEAAAALMLKGATVEYLVRRLAKVRVGDTVLLHAAAGGVGLIASQWLAHLGATVIGTVGTAEKAELASAYGCDHVILYQEEDVPSRVREITDGRGVDVALDGVGAATFRGSLDSLRPRGMMVTFGNASGVVEPFAPIELAKRGSLFVTRPRLLDYYGDPDEAREGIEALLEVVTSGAVKAVIGQTRPLAEAPDVHRELEARRTTGSTVLLA